ncbi:MAG: type II 3-dehydroquinate dehydratase [Acidimicrobiia bacterium]
MKFLVVNGPNLNLLGEREPEIYGHDTLDDLETAWHDLASTLGITIEAIQSNHEGVLIDAIHAARNDVDGIVINAGALTHYSRAIADALTGVGLPYVEVHISNIYEREGWRSVSVLADHADALIVGRGTQGYLDGIRHLHDRLSAPLSE